jgi:hypothetical protein
MRLARVTILIFASVFAVGCKDVSRFSTAPGESYCGQIVAASFVRRGFGDEVHMRMTLDADHLADAPGALSTADQLFTNTPMRPVPELFHDPLSTLNFGEGRDKNLLFAIDPTDAAKGPTITVVVSLMRSGDAEVRLLRGAPAAVGATPGADPLFGVFAPMTRQAGQCW